MGSRIVRTGSLLFLAAVFTAGLTFATLELPYYVDDVLQNTIVTPGGDSHADAIARLKTELFMAHYHVRTVGYIAFFLLVGLIIVGFSTKRTALATLGAVGVMLPAFAQFAGVMFFLAGLGVMNVIWLPVLDVSYELQNWGLVVRLPDDVLRWVLGLFGIHSPWPSIVFFTGAGIFTFLLGVYAWLTARSKGKDVADFWVYRISRHPQYLGWILWTYGAFLLIQLMRYPKRSWGIGASLPWLISTMVIIGVALMEELSMRRRHGEAYDTYQKRAPFLFPVPPIVERFFAAPFRLFFKKVRPDRRREVAAVVGLWTVVLMLVSAVFYDGGLERTALRFASSETRAAKVQKLVTELESETNTRRQYLLVMDVASFGEEAVGPLVALLQRDEPSLRVLAAQGLEAVGSRKAVPALCSAVSDAEEGVRYRSVLALHAIGAREAADCIAPLLDDPADRIRFAALEGLARLGDEIVVERVPSFLAAEDYWRREQVVDALGELGSESAIPVVEASLRDEHAWVRRAAVIALLRIGSAQARPALERMAADDDFEVRIYAAETLNRLPPASERAGR